MVDRRSGKSLCYAPGLGNPTPLAMRFLHAADVVMVDGTLWEDDEMQALGVGTSTGQQMGHLALNGSGGMYEYAAHFDSYQQHQPDFRPHQRGGKNTSGRRHRNSLRRYETHAIALSPILGD